MIGRPPVKYKNRNINTPLFAYFLGWLYSDGCIYNNVSRNSYTVKIKISSIDGDVLKLFNRICEWNIGYEKNGKYITIRNNSREFAKFLLSVGCFVRKSFENASKLKVPQLNENLIPIFIRGLFDGDGNYYWNNKKTSNLHCSITCKNDTLLRQIKKYLLKNDIVSEFKHSFYKNYNICTIRIRKNSEVKKFIDLIFKNNLNLILKRKYNTIKKYLSNYKTVSEICRERQIKKSKKWTNKH